jgi:hypothetical protein
MWCQVVFVCLGATARDRAGVPGSNLCRGDQLGPRRLDCRLSTGREQ